MGGGGGGGGGGGVRVRKNLLGYGEYYQDHLVQSLRCVDVCLFVYRYVCMCIRMSVHVYMQARKLGIFSLISVP